jgi:UPF0716 protein FxsA
MRRRFPWWLLVVAFIVVPIIEIYVIIQVGQVIGAWWTILLLIADSIFGSWLIKREGAKAWRALRMALEEHRLPHRELADGVLILVGGTLMITPGFVSDVFGILCILPFTRPFGRRILAGVVSRRLLGVTTYPGGAPRPGTQPPGTQQPGTQRRPGTDDVVRGEVVD